MKRLRLTPTKNNLLIALDEITPGEYVMHLDSCTWGPCLFGNDTAKLEEDFELAMEAINWIESNEKVD